MVGLGATALGGAGLGVMFSPFGGAFIAAAIPTEGRSLLLAGKITYEAAKMTVTGVADTLVGVAATPSLIKNSGALLYNKARSNGAYSVAPNLGVSNFNLN